MNKQLTLLQQNIYALPIQILPFNPTIAHGVAQQFTAYGGTQTGYVWSFVNNNSGGSLTAGGLYTAGATPAIDTIQVQDSNGNTQNAVIVVT